MEYRTLGKTTLRISSLGFGCGAVGGILVKGSRREMTQAVARAVDLGVNYFDTAAIYGEGRSEENLGLVLAELGADVIVGTKVRLLPTELANIEQAVRASVERSLTRLRRERIDLIQLHTPVAAERRPEQQWVSSADVEATMAVFRRLQTEGKVRAWGFNGLGESAALHQAISGDVQTVQSCFNLLNPTAGVKAPPDFPFQDYGELIDRAAENQVGVMAIRVLAGGALSGSATRHANAAQHVEPIASGGSFVDDVALAQRFGFLVSEGYASSLAQAAIRFALGKAGVTTAVIGISTIEQLEEAATAAHSGPLPAEAYARLVAVWAGLVDADSRVQ
jgi:aryl-alcohol dehydrogenase-like predicted oxidoreductase